MSARGKSSNFVVCVFLFIVYWFFIRKKPDESQADKDVLQVFNNPDVVTHSNGTDSTHTDPVQHDPTVTSSSGNVGIEANNPFNLRQTKPSQKWQGEVGTIYAGSKDKTGFVRFDTPEDGARACLKNMMHVLKKHETILKYITVESPASDGNKPDAYADRVAKAVGIKPTDKLDVNNLDEIAKFAVAINTVEWGRDPLPASMFKNEYVKLNPKANTIVG